MKYKFSELFSDATKDGKKIPKNEYLAKGKFPIIDQGKDEIGGYCNNDEGLYDNVPAIIFGDHTRALKYISTPFFLGADGVKLLKPKKLGNNEKYLFYALKNVNVPDTGYNRHFKWIKQAQFDIPNRSEQNLIVKRLDTIERLIALRQSEIECLDSLVKSRFIEMFGDPVYNSQKRKQLPFSAFMKNIRYGTSQPPVFSDDGEYQFIRATNIKAGKIVPDRLVRISRNEAAKIEKCKLDGGEIIIVRSGVNAGDTCVVTDTYKNQYAGYDIIITLDLNRANPVYFNILLNTHYMNDVVKPLTIRSAQPHLNSQQVQNLLMIDASFGEQNTFADIVNQVDKSKLAVQKSLDELETLKKSLMQQYFG